MGTKIIKLKFSSPVHFGSGRLSEGKPTCDAATLFSALFIEALRENCADELLEAAKEGDLIISDAFPYIGNDYYIPKPLLRIEAVEETSSGSPMQGDSRTKKAYKKLEYLRFIKLESYMAGTMDPFSELDVYNLGAASLQMKVNLERAKTDDAEPYSVGAYSFNESAGLFFVVKGSYDLDPLMDALRYSGIGGKRTSGYGRFTYEIEKSNPLAGAIEACNNRVDSESPKFMLMSSAIPKETELTEGLLFDARYKVARKGGFVQSMTHARTPQRKRDLFAFVPGSMFAHTFEGEILNVNMTGGAHSVYRYAKAMWLEVQ